MSDEIHVMPVNDIRVHHESKDCPCNPRVEENGNIIIHNSFDGREFKESTHLG